MLRVSDMNALPRPYSQYSARQARGAGIAPIASSTFASHRGDCRAFNSRPLMARL